MDNLVNFWSSKEFFWNTAKFTGINGIFVPDQSLCYAKSFPLFSEKKGETKINCVEFMDNFGKTTKSYDEFDCYRYWGKMMNDYFFCASSYHHFIAEIVFSKKKKNRMRKISLIDISVC
jgi:hypothetical protein